MGLLSFLIFPKIDNGRLITDKGSLYLPAYSALLRLYRSFCYGESVKESVEVKNLAGQTEK